MLNDIGKLLGDLNLVLQKSRVKEHESYSKGEKFNIFRVCGVDHYETTHSAILAEFLNPKGGHGKETKYLHLFLNMLKEKGLPFTFSENDVSVYTEYPIDDGRLDILLRNSESQIIVMENKIYACEQNEQLARYGKWAKANSKGHKDYAIIYLTLNGKESETADEKYIRISYSNDILDWMLECAKESFDFPLVRETIKQYVNHLKMLTNNTMDKESKEKFIERLLENYDVASEIMNRKDDFVDAAVRKYLLPNLRSVAKEFELEMSNEEVFLSKRKYADIVFRKRDWSHVEIHFGADMTKWYALYVGVVKRNPESSERIEKLKCMKKSNDLWCGGWRDLDINHIDADTVPQIIPKDQNLSALAREISGIIKAIIDEIETKKISF